MPHKTMASSAIQIHLLGPLTPQLGQLLANRVTGSSHLRQLVRLALAIPTSSGLCGQLLVDVTGKKAAQQIRADEHLEMPR